MTTLVLFLAAMLLAYANGANDNFKATATVFGSGILGYRASLALASVAQLAGSASSLFLASALVRTFGGKGLVPDSVVADPAFILAVAVGGALTVLLATRTGIPVSTTHALIGGLVGAGLALASPQDFNARALGQKYFLPLLLSPLMALGATAIIYPPLSWLRKKIDLGESTCICVGERSPEMVGVGAATAVLRPPGLQITLAESSECPRHAGGVGFQNSAAQIVDALHLVSAFALGFARGLNDTPKIFALLVAANWMGLPSTVSLAVLASTMLCGGIFHSRRLAQTLGRNITKLNRGQGLTANVVSSTLVIVASLMGTPVSTTHVSTGAIFGIGISRRQISWKVAGGIVLAWVVTLPLGAAIAFAVARLGAAS